MRWRYRQCSDSWTARAERAGEGLDCSGGTSCTQVTKCSTHTRPGMHMHEWAVPYNTTMFSCLLPSGLLVNLVVPSFVIPKGIYMLQTERRTTVLPLLFHLARG